MLSKNEFKTLCEANRKTEKPLSDLKNDNPLSAFLKGWVDKNGELTESGRDVLGGHLVGNCPLPSSIAWVVVKDVGLYQSKLRSCLITKKELDNGTVIVFCEKDKLDPKKPLKGNSHYLHVGILTERVEIEEGFLFSIIDCHLDYLEDFSIDFDDVFNGMLDFIDNPDYWVAAEKEAHV